MTKTSSEVFQPLSMAMTTSEFFISCSGSGDKIVTLYEELQSSEMPPHLLLQFEDVLSALLADVRKIDAEKRRMEERITK